MRYVILADSAGRTACWVANIFKDLLEQFRAAQKARIVCRRTVMFTVVPSPDCIVPARYVRKIIA